MVHIHVDNLRNIHLYPGTGETEEWMSMVSSKSVCGTKIVPGQHKRTEFCLEQVTKQNLYYLQKCKSQY